MERKEAVALLKELVDSNLAQPSLIALKENKRGKFDLVIKGDYDTQVITKFLAKKNLALKEGKEEGYCIISKL